MVYGACGGVEAIGKVSVVVAGKWLVYVGCSVEGAELCVGECGYERVTFNFWQ